MKNKNKPNLLFFVPQFPVLSETFIEREISKMAEFSTFNVTVLSLGAGTGVASNNIKDKIEYRRISLGICLKAFFRYVFRDFALLKQTHELVKGEDNIPYLLNLKSDSSDRTRFSVLGRFHNSRFVHFWKGVAYAEIFREYSPDHVHVHFLSDNSTVGMVASKLLKVPFSISAHAKDVFVEASLVPIKAREAKFITVCNGNTWKEVVKQANATKSSGKVKLLFHGVDPDKFFDVQVPEKPNKPFILTIARLVEKKGIKYLLEASRILRDRGIDHIVKVAGGGPLYEELSQLIKEYSLENNFVILGTEDDGVPNAEVAGHLQVADIYAAPFVVSSSGDIDGVPTTVIEAALAKLPIIATNVGSISDLVTSDTGLIVEDSNSEAIADAVEKILNDKELSAKLTDNAYTKAREMFDIDTNIRELERLILS